MGSRTKGGAETLRAGTRIWKADCGAGGGALSPHREGLTGTCGHGQWPGVRRQLHPRPVTAVGTGASWESACCSCGLEVGLRPARGGGEPGAAPAQTPLRRQPRGPASPHRGLGTWGDAGRLQGGGRTAGPGMSLHSLGVGKGRGANGLPNPLPLLSPESSGWHPWLAASSAHLQIRSKTHQGMLRSRYGTAAAGPLPWLAVSRPRKVPPGYSRGGSHPLNPPHGAPLQTLPQAMVPASLCGRTSPEHPKLA